MAEMWVSESGFAHWREAGVQLIGYAIRTVRPRAYAGKPAVAPPLEDADGELDRLHGMGFVDDDQNLKALRAVDGNVDQAIALLVA